MAPVPATHLLHRLRHALDGPFAGLSVHRVPWRAQRRLLQAQQRRGAEVCGEYRLRYDLLVPGDQLLASSAMLSESGVLKVLTLVEP